MNSSISLKQTVEPDPVLVRDPFDNTQASLTSEQQRQQLLSKPIISSTTTPPNNNNISDYNNPNRSKSPRGSYNPIHNDPKSRCQRCCNRRCCKTACFIITGIILLLFSIQFTFLPNLIPNLLHAHVRSALIFTKPMPGHYHYESWKSNNYGNKKTPILFSISFFNVTNPEDVLKNGSIPKLNYTKKVVYEANYNRTNVTFDDTKQWCSYDFYVWFVNNVDLSTMRENETYTIISPLLGGLYQQYLTATSIEERFAISEIFNYIESHPDNYAIAYDLLFWHGTVYDLIWSIYNFTTKYPNGTIHKHFEWGLMFNRTNQYYTTHTGHKDNARMSEIYSFGKNFSATNILPKSPFIYKWDPATAVAPSRLFYFGVYNLYNDKNNVDPIWIDILYRGVDLEYNKTINNFDGNNGNAGIELYSYHIPLSPQFDNVSINPAMAQFYQYGPSGVFNLTSAYGGIPFFVSFPFFWGAEDYAKNNSKFGIRQPSDDTDIAYINIEPKTGAIFEAKALMQLNFVMHSLPINDSVLSKLPDDLMVPSYMVGYEEKLNKKTANGLRDTLNLAYTVEKVAKIGGYVAIPLLVLYGSYLFYMVGYFRGRKEILQAGLRMD